MNDPITDLDTIPTALKTRGQWLHWDNSADTPRRPHQNGAFTVPWSDPGSWLEFDDAALEAADRESWGIGYVTAVNNDDEPMGVVSVIDLDDAADENDELYDWVPSIEPFLERDCYIEWSPSHSESGDSGLHIPIVGMSVPDWWSDSHIDGGHAGADLLSNKFCTVTGDIYEGAGGDLPNWDDWVIDWLAELYENITGESPNREIEPESDLLNYEAGDSDTFDEEWLDEETVAEALDTINPNCSYDKWRNIGFALSDHFSGHTAERMFDEWSRGSSKYDDKAKDIIEDIANRDGTGITIGTLIHHAKEAGWEPTHHKPELDVISDEGRDEHPPQVPEGQTDGGTTAVDPSSGTVSLSSSFEDDVHGAITAAENDDIQVKTARHLIARALNSHFNFAYPEAAVHGWRSTLYVYNDKEGIYEPRGESFIQKRLERAAGDWVTNQVTKEIVEKVKRMNIARGDRFSTSPERLVVGNGILDLHTGELSKWTPEELHKTKVDVDWNPDAGDPDRIDEFFNEIVEPDDTGTLYRLIAHSLYKEYAAEKAAMLVGGGQNGKSVFLSFLEEFLGEGNVTHRALQDFEDQFAANQLQGKLANIHPDMGDEGVTDMSTFKKLTGRDTMLADVKYEEPLQFENYASLMFAANEMPVFGEDNHAVWRRWVYISFPHTFDENDPDAKEQIPKRVLMQELCDDDQLEALLLRCQKEIEEWVGGRSWFPDAMQPDEVRTQMKKAAEPVFNFAASCLRDVDDEDAWLPKDQVRKCYREYATQEGLPKLTSDRFGEELINLRDYTIESVRRRQEGNRIRAYQGVELTARGREILGLDRNEDDAQNTVDEVASAKEDVLNEVRDMVAENDNEPVPIEGVVWRVSNSTGRVTARNTVDSLIKGGDLLSTDGETVIDT